MLYLICWVVFSLIVGFLAKLIHPGEDPVGWLSTITIGFMGSFTGGAIKWILNMGGPFGPAGLFWSVVGGIACCWIYRHYRITNFLKIQGRMPK